MSKKKHEDALAWLTNAGNKAMQNQNKKELDIIRFLLTEIQKPDYEKEILTARKTFEQKGSMSLSTFCKIFTNPNRKPKTINQKANKRT